MISSVQVLLQYQYLPVFGQVTRGLSVGGSEDAPGGECILGKRLGNSENSMVKSLNYPPLPHTSISEPSVVWEVI